MGYTHYYQVNKKAIQGNTEKLEAKYQLALKKCQAIAKAYNSELKAIDVKHPNRLSGYTVHSKPGQYGGLFINGTGEHAHEDFCLREHLKENASEFCKTAHKPYDQVVVACLIVLKHYLGPAFEVNSDGDACDWKDGLSLAKQVTKLKTLKVPKSIEVTSTCEREHLDFETAKKMLVKKGQVHTFRAYGSMLLGCDMDVKEVLKLIERYRVELSGENMARLDHKLALKDDKGWLFIECLGEAK